MLGNTSLTMSLFLPVNIIKAPANFFPLSRIPASFRGEVGVEAFLKEQALVLCRAVGATLALHWSISVGTIHIKQLLRQPATRLLNISSGAKNILVDQFSSH